MAEDFKKVKQAVFRTRASIVANWTMFLSVSSLLAMDNSTLDSVITFVDDTIPCIGNVIELFKSGTEEGKTNCLMKMIPDTWTEYIVSLILGITGGHALSRQSKTIGRASEHFTQKDYTEFPQIRPGYSDRAAYTMAELAEIAYHRIRPDFEISGQLTMALKKMFPNQASSVDQIADAVNANAKEIDICNLDSFKLKLETGEFTYVTHFDDLDVQGFVCLKNKKGHAPYIVVAFRGSEARIEDWLTNATAVPKSPTIGNGLVHSGFYDSFIRVKQQIIDAVAEANELARATEPLPVYYTGHSLGGALALIAARTFEYEAKKNHLPENIGNACYTFGAPRAGNYAYFEKMKTPVYRVVNSSDIVPRVPPGAWSKVFSVALKGLGQLFTWQPALSKGFDYLEDYFSKLHIYRHHGDMRYLPDVADINDKQANAQVMSNPNHLDLSLWFWRRISVSLGSTVKSHSMQIYLKKLTHVANGRQSNNLD